jgi:hypothetical protein
MRFDMGNPDRKYYCNICKQMHTKEELQNCRSMHNQIQQHNESRHGRGLKFKSSLIQYASHVANKKCRDKKWRAYYDNSLDKIFIELKSFQKTNGDMDLEALVCVVSHETIHKWLFDNQGIRATHMLDYALIELAQYRVVIRSSFFKKYRKIPV